MKQALLLFLLFGGLLTFFMTQVVFSSVRADNQVLVAVIDSGVDYNHSELKGRVIKGYDFVERDDDPMDQNGHGTHVATQILNKTKEAKVLAVRTLNAQGEGGGESILGVFYALWKGADIINMSYSETYHPFMPFLIWVGEKKEVLFVAATGNEGKNEINYPANYPGVVPIGAVDDLRNELYEEGNIDENVQFVAPGVRLEGADIHDAYSLRTGTSMATGYASGVMAHVLEQNPHANNDAIYAYLEKHASLTKDKRFQLLEYDRFAALTDPTHLYATINEHPAMTKQDVFALSVDTMNATKIDVFNERDELVLTLKEWEQTVDIPLKKEGYQTLTIRFSNEKERKDLPFNIIKDTKAPEISYFQQSDDYVSFVVTDHTLNQITLNGKHANHYIRSNRKKDYTYHFVAPIEKNKPNVIEIQDGLGHKTVKTLYESAKK